MPCRSRRRLLTAWPALAWPTWACAQSTARGPTVLRVSGSIRPPPGGNAVEFDLAGLAAMRAHRIRTRTPWHNGTPEFAGPLLRDVLDAVGAQGSTLRMVALNDYHVDVPVEDARRFDVILAHQLDGQPMSVRDKGPLFVMYPFDRHPELRTTVYLSRCIWQLRGIEVR